VSDRYLVPCLVALRDEFDRMSPKRDRGADGWIGDAAHASRTSDHNPLPDGRVLALDIDSTGPWPEYDLHAAVWDIVQEHRLGDQARLEYVIWQRKIASRASSWSWQQYDGADPHTNHAHFSARHDRTGETDTTYWGVCMNPADITKIAKAASDLTITAYTNTLRNAKSELHAVAAATPWQYGAGVIKAGLPEDNVSMLWLMNDLHARLERIEAGVLAVESAVVVSP
jgi:hypothetical protein